MQKHFDESKALLMKATKLVHPDPAAPLAMTTDASMVAIGAVLEQFVNGTWQPLGFWSRHLDIMDFSLGLQLYCETSKGCKMRPFIPKPWRQTIMAMFHNVAHCGIQETINKVSL